MAIKGLPIGQGEVWHDPAQRRLLLSLAALALLPSAGLVAEALGWLASGTYASWVLTPALLAFLAVSVRVGVRHRALSKRLLVGLGVGLAGGLAYAGLLILGQSLGSMSLSAPLSRLLGLAVTWGVAYALVAGKARWYWGLAWSGLAGVCLGAATLMAPGVALPSFTSLLAFLVFQFGFGAMIGALNEALQPQARSQGKIVFLRDYASKVRQR